MNTIEELRALPKIVANLEQKKWDIQGQINKYYDPLEKIIEEVLNLSKRNLILGQLELIDNFVKFDVICNEDDSLYDRFP
jgi:hypothetical protein